MNARTLVLIGAVALLGVGMLLTLAQLFDEPTQVQMTTPAIAAEQIEPYTVITQDMVQTGDEIPAREAQDRGAYPVQSVVGLMATDMIAPGEILTGVNAKPIDEVRFVEDLGLEIVSFQAGIPQVVGGSLRPGHIVNLYGFSTGADEDTFTTLIEPRLWVVGVTSGGQIAVRSTPQPNPRTGEYLEEGADRNRPASLITVAVPPEKAYRIIDALGAQGLTPYVTLAANQTVSGTELATPVPQAAAPTATPGLPPDLALTATALWNALQPTAPAEPPVTGGGGAQR